MEKSDSKGVRDNIKIMTETVYGRWRCDVNRELNICLSHRRHCTSWVRGQDVQKSWADEQQGLDDHLFSYIQATGGFP